MNIDLSAAPGVSAPADALLRPNTLTIDLDAIAERVREIRAAVGPGIRFFATLKADAYGFGVLAVARTVIEAGADAISIVSLADAVRLREAGLTCPVLVYAGALPDREVVQAVEAHGLMPTLHDDSTLDAYVRHARGPLDCAVKIDVGQERIGVPAERAPAFLARIAASGRLRLALVNAHPYIASGAGALEALQWQCARFTEACRAAEQLGVTIPLRVLASSKVLRMTSAMSLDGIDPGQGLFDGLGLDSAAGQARRWPLACLTSRLIQVRRLERSAFLEQAPFPLRANMRLGIVPIGYSDGIHRAHAGCVLVHGRRSPLLASPSLEYTRIDLTEVPGAQVGDEVVFIGAQGEERIAPDEVMRARGIARLPDLMLELKPSIARRYVRVASSGR